MAEQELIPHLFRTEYRKIVAVLSKRFGFDQVETAEDIASDTFLSAAQVWGLNGLPQNPVAWLYHVAKNKAKNHLQRLAVFEKKIAPEIKSLISSAENEIDLSPQNITDSQLQMMFAICNPAISPEAQIGLSLRILCGFGLDEMADAFLTNRETIHKRLVRAKEKLRAEKIKIELPETTLMEGRLETVLTTIYLLFNEGYYSLNSHQILRKDFCLEAIRLCHMLLENEKTRQPAVNALMALMCFHASRFDARFSRHGEEIFYADQDESLWNTELISRGAYFLKQASEGSRLSKFHIEAAIAFWATQKTDNREKWKNVLKLYDQLLSFENSPIIALNRIWAISRLEGKESAILQAEQLSLGDNPFYFTLLGELYTGIHAGKAIENLEKALLLVKTEAGKQSIRRKIRRI